MRPLIVAVLLTAGCRFSTDFSDTAYACPDGECPSGFECVQQRCVTDTPPPDSSTAPSDGMLPDAEDCVCVAEVRADSCGSETLEEAAQPGGQRVCASTAVNSNQLLGCSGAPMPAADAVFRVPVVAGQTLDATLRPQAFDGSLYLLSDCSMACLAISDESGVGGTETLSMQAATTGDLFVAVDSSSGTGCYELLVAVSD